MEPLKLTKLNKDKISHLGEFFDLKPRGFNITLIPEQFF